MGRWGDREIGIESCTFDRNLVLEVENPWATAAGMISKGTADHRIRE
ncbi:hypothetical protein [Moorena sp. SIO4A5]|nr:hypothetical protein [Moorena sp. SIO4A5]NEO24832.1 hypothetical protein [Moorena sp. SIO4A5]NEO44744.1 hypothetical protein [Moorena sp. SIO4A3]